MVERERVGYGPGEVTDPEKIRNYVKIEDNSVTRDNKLQKMSTRGRGRLKRTIQWPCESQGIKDINTSPNFGKKTGIAMREIDKVLSFEAIKGDQRRKWTVARSQKI